MPGRPRDYITKDTPTTALLIVEVSDATLSFDRHKANLYAQAGIADYWIVNLVDRQLEVHRGPGADAAQPFGFGYVARTTHDPGDVIAPLAAPKACGRRGPAAVKWPHETGRRVGIGGSEKEKNGGRFLTAANGCGLIRDRNRLTSASDMLTGTGQDQHQFNVQSRSLRTR